MNIVVDLDGVVYRGDASIPGSSDALQRARDHGARIWFVTNNSTRTPDDVVAKVRRLTGFDCEFGSVVTSAQAAASMLGLADSPVFVLGSPSIGEALASEALVTTDDPDQARAVVVGMDRALTYDRLAGAVSAVRGGARFVATNIDPTYPVEAGFQPGSGAIVAAVATAAERSPEVAGKPNEATRRLLEKKGVDAAWVVGDRVDTDVALAEGNPGWRSVLVLTGVTGPDDSPGAADHVVRDLAAAMDLILE